MLESDPPPALGECGRRQENSGHEEQKGALEHGAFPSELEGLPAWPGRKRLSQHDDTPARRLPRHRPPRAMWPSQCGRGCFCVASVTSQAQYYKPRSLDTCCIFRLSRELPAFGPPCLIRGQSTRPSLRKVCPHAPAYSRISLISGNNLPLYQPGRPMRRVRPRAAT